MALVRRATLADAEAIAAVHVASWETTYTGILPEAFISERTVAVRHAFWRDRLADADPAVSIFVACADDGSVCGFASGGPELNGRLGAEGELYSLYLLEGAQGMGLGRRLVAAVLAELPPGRISVWVLGDNPARRFYERMGGRLIAEQYEEMGGEKFLEVAYDLGAR